MKRLPLLFFMSMAITTLYSQIKFMPKAGASLSHVSYSNDLMYDGEDYSSKIGLIVGLAVEIPLIGERLSLQPELLFHQKGFKYKYDDVDYHDDYNYTLNYLELPVLAKVHFGKFYAEAGPSFAYGIGGKYKGTSDYGNGSETFTGKVKFGDEPDNSNPDDEYIDNALDINIQVGVGIKISVIVIDLRYGLGMTNLYDAVDGYDNKSKNGSFQLTIGVPLGGK